MTLHTFLLYKTNPLIPSSSSFILHQIPLQFPSTKTPQNSQTMEHRTLEINVMSAKDLNKVNFITKMDVYVVVSISGADDRNEQKTKTHVDHDGDNNPTWNFPIKFSIDNNAAVHNRLNLVFKLRCQRALGDKDIGEVHVPVKELLDSPNNNGSKQFVSYQIRKPSGKPKGQLTFSYQFGDKIMTSVDSKVDQPMTAFPAMNPAPMVGSTSVYPPPSHGPSGPYLPPHEAGYGGNGSYPPPPTGYPPQPAVGAACSGNGSNPPPSTGYPPQPVVSAGYSGNGSNPPPPAAYPPQGAGGYGYGYPPPTAAPYSGYPPPPQYGYPPQQGGYGYPPQQGGYGYPPVQQPPKKNSKFGLGLGAGLLGGALGGMLIGDAISDAGGYDSGFGDGGFDF